MKGYYDGLTGIKEYERSGVIMCQTCGCNPCKKCGQPIENKVCTGCKKPAKDCSCKPKPQQ